MEFIPGAEVLWHGAAARVVEVRGDRVALSRASDDQTILTTIDLLQGQQPVVLRRSLLGPT